MGIQKIPYRNRNIKFHLDPFALRPTAVESKVPFCCRIGKNRVPIEIKLYLTGARWHAHAQGKVSRRSWLDFQSYFAKIRIERDLLDGNCAIVQLQRRFS